MYDPRRHQIKAEISSTRRVRDQGDDYRGIEATNSQINKQKQGEQIQPKMSSDAKEKSSLPPL
jgi:hypothetical protein